MLRSNSKKALENLRGYILKNTDTSNREEYKEPETFKEAAAIIVDCFYDEYMHGYNLRRNRQECFVDWLSGLPSIFDSCYYYNRSAVDDLGAILEETDEEKSKYTESQAEEMLSRLVYREVAKATGRYW